MLKSYKKETPNFIDTIVECRNYLLVCQVLLHMFLCLFLIMFLMEHFRSLRFSLQNLLANKLYMVGNNIFNDFATIECI